MKTVQEYLIELDTKKLVDAYLEKEPIDYDKDESLKLYPIYMLPFILEEL